MPLVSVITPCYNQGKFVKETIGSVLNQTFEDYEHIIVNDGSTDDHTLKILEGVNHKKIRILHTTNQGLPTARNNAIQESSGEIILPLDSDDKISPEYLKKAVEVYDKDNGIGIVYSFTKYFGRKNSLCKLPGFSLPEMLFHNLIPASAFFLKKDWSQCGGYNKNMKYGWEDWDFWLSLLELGVKVHRIPEVHFYYRVNQKSMLDSMKREHKIAMRAQVMRNHLSFYESNLDLLSEGIEMLYRTVPEKIKEGGISYLKSAVKGMFS